MKRVFASDITQKEMNLLKSELSTEQIADLLFVVEQYESNKRTDTEYITKLSLQPVF